MKKSIYLTALSVALASTMLLGGCKIEKPDASTEAYVGTTNEYGETSPRPSGSTEGTKAPVREKYTFTDTETSLFVYRDGKVESLETDDHFDKEYYSLDEFRNDMLYPVIRDYNKSQGAAAEVESGPVALTALELKDATLSMKLKYQSAKDYLAFNKSFNEFFAGWNVFTVCKVSEAAANGIDISGAFTDLEGNAISSSRIKETCQDYYVCAVNYGGALPSGVSGKLFTEGNIAYLSNGLSIDNKNSVLLDGKDGIQFIIFY